MVDIAEIYKKIESLPDGKPSIIDDYHVYYSIEQKSGPVETCLDCHEKDINWGGIRIINLKTDVEFYLPFIAKHFIEKHSELTYKGTDNCGTIELEELCSVLEIDMLRMN